MPTIPKPEHKNYSIGSHLEEAEEAINDARYHMELAQTFLEDGASQWDERVIRLRWLMSVAETEIEAIRQELARNSG